MAVSGRPPQPGSRLTEPTGIIPVMQISSHIEALADAARRLSVAATEAGPDAAVP